MNSYAVKWGVCLSYVLLCYCCAYWQRGKAMTKPRVHNEYFRTVSLGGRKSCPYCKAKLEREESIWSWGEYVRGKWYTVRYLCKLCFPAIQQQLVGHSKPCGCEIVLQRYGAERLPAWLTLEGKVHE